MRAILWRIWEVTHFAARVAVPAATRAGAVAACLELRQRSEEVFRFIAKKPYITTAVAIPSATRARAVAASTELDDDRAPAADSEVGNAGLVDKSVRARNNASARNL